MLEPTLKREEPGSSGLKHARRDGVLLKAATSSAVLKIYALGLSFVTGLLLARIMGPGGYGAYTFAISLVSVLSVPSGLGLDRLSLRLVPAYVVHNNWGMLRGFLVFSSGWTIFASLSLAAVAAGAVLQGYVPIDPQLRGPVLAALLMVPLLAMNALRQLTLRGLQLVAMSQLPELMLKPTLFLLAVAALAYMDASKLTAVNAVWISSVVAIATFLVGTAVLRHKLRRVLNKGTQPVIAIKSWLSDAVPFAMIALIMVTNDRMEVLMLGVLSTPDQIGIFQVASRLAELNVMALYAFNTAAAPRIAELMAQHNIDEVRRLSQRVTTFIFLLTMPITLAYIFAGKQILQLFGDAFETGFPVLILLSVGQIFNAATGSVGTVLTLSAKTSLTVLSVLIGLATHLILGAMLIPRFGALGAAVAGSTALMAWNGALLFFCIRYLGINPSVFTFLAPRTG
jgi:O-antigen/teichoic acid export membrane protein